MAWRTQCGMIRYDVWYGEEWLLWYALLWHGVVWYGIIWYDMVWYDVMIYVMVRMVCKGWYTTLGRFMVCYAVV